MLCQAWAIVDTCDSCYSLSRWKGRQPGRPVLVILTRATYLVGQDQAQLESTIGNIGISSSSDTGSDTEGGSGGGEEHGRGRT